MKTAKASKSRPSRPAASRHARRADPGPVETARAPLWDRWWGIVIAALATFLLTLPLFAPWSWWPLGFVALVPWMSVACLTVRTRWLYVMSYLLGAAFFLFHMRWLYWATGPGYFAGSLYLALSFVIAAWVVRHLHRRRGVSPAFALPVVWAGVELLRSSGALAMPWFLLGHAQIRLLPMIQIADLFGVYGVSFVVAMGNGWLVDLVIRWSRRHAGTAPAWRSVRATTVAFAVALAATLGYGSMRLRENTPTASPTIAVIQGDYTMSAEGGDLELELSKPAAYWRLIEEAARSSPAMIVLPETPWSLTLNREFREMSDQVLRERYRTYLSYWFGRRKDAGKAHQKFLDFTREHQTHLVVGSISDVPQPPGSYPDAHRYNSAFVYTPDGGEPQRYDKIHLVPFGEYVPLRYVKGLHWLYSWLNSITPWGADGTEYSLTHGTRFHGFNMAPASTDAEPLRFGITICYEDAVPGVFRRLVLDEQGGKRADFMLNISNDGWFGRGTQQPQHLVGCAFRAVENRVGVARAVNTGVSGFIEPTGRWHDLVLPRGAKGPKAGGTGIGFGSVGINPRVTLYSRYGDVFGWACAALVMLGGLDAFAARRRERRAARRAMVQEETS